MADDEVAFGDIIDAPAEVQPAAKFRPKVRAKPRKLSVPSRALMPNPNVETAVEGVGALGQDTQEHASNQESISLGQDTQEHASNQESISLMPVSSKTVADATARGNLDTPSEDVLPAPLIPVNNPNVASDSSTGGVNDVDSVSHTDGQNDDLPVAATHQDNLVVSDTRVLSTHSIGETIDDLADIGGLSNAQVEDKRVTRFQPKIVKPRKAASKLQETNQNAGASTVDEISQNKEDGHNKPGCNDSQLQDPRHQEIVQTLESEASLGTNESIVDNLANPGILEEPLQENTTANSQEDLMISHADGTQLIFEEPSDEATVQFQPNIGRKKHKGKKVSFVLPDPSEGAAPADTDSDMSSLSHSCNGTSFDENLNITPQETAEKEYTERKNQHHEIEPPDHADQQHPKLGVREIGLSMELRSREKMQKVGIPERTVDVNFDEDFVEPLAAEQDNDSDDEYTVGGKQKFRRKSKEKDVNKKPSRGSKRTSADSPIEELQQQKLNKNRSAVSSQKRKRTSKDTSAEQPEKKLTHRIRQKRMKEVKTLLETPDHEIDRMKLSVAHLRLLQESRERAKGKEILPGPSSYQSSLPGDMDDFDNFGVDNNDNDRTENHVLQNATKLNYHSYMNRQSRAKWSKSDMDLFYQGLQQFGTDFAMIQQLFPDKTRDHVRQKYKTEEKKNPMRVHDATFRRSRDNLYFRQVIKQLNIADVQLETNYKDKQQTASKGVLGHENELDNFINEGEENGSNWSDKEQDIQGEENGSNWSDREQDMPISKVKEGEHVSANADDDLDDVFDWY